MENKLLSRNEKILSDCWGKFAKDDESNYHPVLYHMFDTAIVSEILWQKVLSTGIRNQISSALGLNESQCQSFIIFLTGLHDIGKISPAFQLKNNAQKELLKTHGFNFNLLCGEDKHGILGYKAIIDILTELNSSLGKDRITTQVLASIPAAHHGVFPKSEELENISNSLGTGMWAEIRLYAAQKIWDLANSNCILEDYNFCEINDPGVLPIVTGLISVADWIASDEDYFPYSSRIPLNDYVTVSKNRAEIALTKLGWLPSVKAPVSIPFEEIFSFAPNSLQQDIVRICDNLNNPYIMVVESQMGCGKTEAALYAADSALSNKINTGMYFALPTQATGNAMFERVRDDYITKRGFDGKSNLQLVHGNAILSDLVKIAIKGDSSSNDSIDAQSWFLNKKRALLAPFGVGTIDQSLLSVLQTKHWFVRLFGLANKVVIFDEVHAYDTYMSTLLDRLVQWLSSINATVIILSATLPENKMQAIIKSYSNESINASDIAKYPRITYAKCNSKPISIHSESKSESKAVNQRFCKPEPQAIADMAIDKLENGGCGAIICNTVNRAQEVYDEISSKFSSEECALFHARTLYGWRNEIESSVKEKFGKPDKNGLTAKRPKRFVLVATQVIEQSMDLDFDWILSDIAPIDLLLQRMGRMWRHKRNDRNYSDNIEFCIAIDSKDDAKTPSFETNASIYDTYILLKTWITIKDMVQIILPDDIDTMVQTVYSNDTEDYVYEEELKKAHSDFLESLNEDAKKAYRLLISSPTYPDELIEKFNLQLFDDEDPDIHETLRAATRLGNPSLSIICLTRNGETLCDSIDNMPVNINSEPGMDVIRVLHKSAVSISDKRLYWKLKKLEVPKAWQKSSALRYARILEFVNGKNDEYNLVLSKEKGLIINREITQ